MSAPAAPPPDLLRAATALDPDRFETFVGQLLRARADRHAPRVGPGEAALLTRVSAGPPADEWGRYRRLTDARRAGTLTPDEHAELIRLTDVVEGHHADRVAALAELAAARRVPLAELAAALGFGPGG